MRAYVTISGGSNMPSRKRVRHQALERHVDLGLADESVSDRLYQRAVLPAAGQIRARLDGDRGSFGLGLREAVVLVDVFDGRAVRDDVAAEAPLAAQDVVQLFVGARGFAVRAVVGAHHASARPSTTSARNAGRYVSRMSLSSALASKLCRSGSGPLCTA